MKQALEFGRVAVYAALFAFLLSMTAASIELTSVVRQLVPQAASAAASIKAIAKSTSDVEEATYATEGEVANLADTMNGIASGLASNETSELEQARDASMKLSELLDHADLVVMGLGATEQATINAINGIGSDSHKTLDAARQAIDDAAVQASNPAIAESLSDIRDSAASVKDSTAQMTVAMTQVTATAVDARQVADHWRAEVLAPASKVKQAAYFTATIVGRILGL